MNSIKAIETRYKGYRFRSRLEARWAVFFDALGVKWEYEKEGFDLTDVYVDYLAGLERERDDVLAWNQQLNCAMRLRDEALLSPEMIDELHSSVRYRKWRDGAVLDGFDDPFCIALPESLTLPTHEDHVVDVNLEEVWSLEERDWPLLHVPEVPEIDASLNLRYLPDFYLQDQDLWIEIKPKGNEMPWFCDERHGLFAKVRNFAVVYGHPGNPIPYEASGPYAACVATDSPYFWCLCPWCGKLGLEFDGRGARVCGYKKHFDSEDKALDAIKHLGHRRADDKCYTLHDERLIRASEIAMSARFEHGESPQINRR